MTNAHPITRILGTLCTADGAGLVRLEDRYDTDINDLWSALTDPRRLARWYGEVEGDLRVGGEFRDRVFASGWAGTSRIEVCEPPQRLVVTTTEDAEATEATEPSNTVQAILTADGDQTILVIEVKGVPIDKIEFYAAGWQIHAEDLAAHLSGQERSDAKPRFGELIPPYQALAAEIR